MRRTIKIAGAALAAVASLTACLPPSMYPGMQGFTKARGDDRQSITVSVDGPPGIDINAAIAPWNETAGWNLLQPVNGPADIVFKQRAMDLHPFWAPAKADANGVYVSCTIWFDARWSGDMVRWTVWFVTHELGHCLGYPDVYVFGPYVGVMAYPNFYDAGHRARDWFQVDDREMLVRDGYVP